MKKIIIDINCNGLECAQCAWKRHLHPSSIIFLRCDLFNVVLEHKYNDKAELEGKRCQECIEREVSLP